MTNRFDRLVLVQAILDCRRLVAHHSSTVQGSLHTLIMAVLPSVDALRSSTAKDAISLFQVGLQGSPLITVATPCADVQWHPKLQHGSAA